MPSVPHVYFLRYCRTDLNFSNGLRLKPLWNLTSAFSFPHLLRDTFQVCTQKASSPEPTKAQAHQHHKSLNQFVVKAGTKLERMLEEPYAHLQ